MAAWTTWLMAWSDRWSTASGTHSDGVRPRIRQGAFHGCLVLWDHRGTSEDGEQQGGAWHAPGSTQMVLAARPPEHP